MLDRLPDSGYFKPRWASHVPIETSYGQRGQLGDCLHPNLVVVAIVLQPDTLEAARARGGTRSAVVLNCCPPFGSWTAEAGEAIDVLGAERCPVTFGQRIAHARSVTSGRTAQELEPRSTAAAELKRLYRWCMEVST